MLMDDVKEMDNYVTKPYNKMLIVESRKWVHGCLL